MAAELGVRHLLFCKWVRVGSGMDLDGLVAECWLSCGASAVVLPLNEASPAPQTYRVAISRLRCLPAQTA
jgi:hypothetical protein